MPADSFQDATIIELREVIDFDHILFDLRSSVRALFEMSGTPDGLQQILSDGGLISESALALALVFGRMKCATQQQAAE